MNSDLHNADGDQDVTPKYAIGDSYGVLIFTRQLYSGEKLLGPIIEGPHKSLYREFIGYRHGATGDETQGDSLVQYGERVVDMAKKLSEIPLRAGRPARQ